MFRDIVIVAASWSQLWYPDIAALIHTSKTFRAGLQFARTRAFDQDILVLSPRYGLLKLDDKVEPCALDWGDKGAADKDLLISQIAKSYPERLRFLMLCPTPQATLLLDAYRRSKRQHAPFDAPLLGMLQPNHIKWLTQNYEPNPDIMNHPDNIKADGGRRVKLRAEAKSLEDAQIIADQWSHIYEGQLLYPIKPEQENRGGWFVSAILLMSD